jgi:hypothetical protein
VWHHFNASTLLTDARPGRRRCSTGACTTPSLPRRQLPHARSPVKRRARGQSNAFACFPTQSAVLAALDELSTGGATRVMLSSRVLPGGTSMADVMIKCPVTDQEICTGIEADQRSFKNSLFQDRTVVCVSCGQIHKWSKRDAFLR